jgi:hypothetical protein
MSSDSARFFIPPLNMDDYDSFLGTSVQFAEAEILKLEAEHAKQMEIDVQDLIDSGFLDSDYFDSLEDEFEDEDVYEESEEKEIAFVTAGGEIIENLSSNSEVDSSDSKLMIVDKEAEAVIIASEVENVEEIVVIADENEEDVQMQIQHRIEQHPKSVLYSVLWLIISVSVFLQTIDDIKQESILLRKQQSKQHSQNITLLNELLSELGFEVKICHVHCRSSSASNKNRSEIEMQHMQNFHTTDIYQFTQEFKFRPLMLPLPPRLAKDAAAKNDSNNRKREMRMGKRKRKHSFRDQLQFRDKLFAEKDESENENNNNNNNNNNQIKQYKKNLKVNVLHIDDNGDVRATHFDIHAMYYQMKNVQKKAMPITSSKMAAVMKPVQIRLRSVIYSSPTMVGCAASYPLLSALNSIFRNHHFCTMIVTSMLAIVLAFVGLRFD